MSSVGFIDLFGFVPSDQAEPEPAPEFKFLTDEEVAYEIQQLAEIVATRYTPGRHGLSKDERRVLRAVNEYKRRMGLPPADALEFEIGLKETYSRGEAYHREFCERLERWDLSRKQREEKGTGSPVGAWLREFWRGITSSE